MTAGQFAQESSSTGEWKRQGNRFTGRITRDTRSAPGAGPGRPGPLAGRARAVPAGGQPGLPVGAPVGDRPASCSAWRTRSAWRSSTRSATSAAGGSPWTRTAATRCSASSSCPRRTCGRDPSYDGRVTVPAIVDTRTGLVVTNDYPQITLDLSTEWTDLHRDGAPAADPEPDRAEMDELIEDIYRDVNNGVYRCGFATTPGGLRGGVRRCCSRGSTSSRSGWRTARTCSGTRSARSTSASSPRWSASTRSTTATSSATARS